MDLAQLVHPTAGGLACAVGAVVAGAPLFSDGLRAARLAAHVAALERKPIGCDLEGFVHVSGEIVLESPLVTPLTSRDCAGYRLELRPIGAPLALAIEERRCFRVDDGTESALVASTGGRWSYVTTAERLIGPDEAIPDGVDERLGASGRVRAWRRLGGRLRLTERALLAGRTCHVVGFARRARALDVPLEVELARTGTDDEPVVVEALAAPVTELWLGPGESLDFLLVSHARPRAAELSVPRWRTLGAAIGPALTLAGLLYLAHAADTLRALHARSG
ncbi:MAG TPA: hypothetical protein VMS88_04755 [Terriglobales bacterium]|nr:hypothetical protein [Terriglobales bacterium]